MSVAVATSPALAGGHSPSLRHRDDPGLFNDVRPSQLVTCLDMLPSSPLMYSTPKLSSPFISSCKSSPAHSGMPPPSPRVQCSPRTSSIDMPPPSPRVQCSPRTASWPSSVAPPNSRSCPCGGQPPCPSGCCTLSASPNESKWHFSPAEIKYTLDIHHDTKYGIPTFEPPSTRSNTSPCARYSRGTASLPAVIESPSPRFGSSGGIFSTRSFPGLSSVYAKLTPTIQLDCDDSSRNGEVLPSGLEGSRISPVKKGLFLEVPGEDVVPDSPSKSNVNKDGGDSSVIVERPATPPLKRKRPPKLDIQLCTSPASSMPHILDLGEDAMNDLTVEGSYYGIACKKGRRKTLEDTHRAVPELHGDPSQAFFGVFDGHGGRMAADFVAENMVSKISEAIAGSEGEGSIEAAVRAGYLATDAEFLQKGVGSGASCVTALVKDGHLVVANAGDCRAVLCRAGVAEALTSDHRASREDERQRIENLGGYVDNLTGPWRVQGTLAISRGIGDLHMKEWITAEPEVQRLPITSDCEFLILASDGLWDVVSNQEAVDIARPLLQAERVNMDVMDLHIPLAMASSSLSKGNDDGSLKPDELWSRGNQSSIVKPFEKWVELNSVHVNNGETVSSGDGEEDVDYCVGTLDNETPNIGFPELPAPTAGPATACKRLVEESVKRGCLDDISVMIVDRIYSTFKGNHHWRAVDMSSSLGSDGIVSICATNVNREGFECSNLQSWPKAR